MTNWVRLLAGEFHGFYHDCRVLSEEVPPELTQARLWRAVSYTHLPRVNTREEIGMLMAGVKSAVPPLAGEPATASP